MNFRDFLFKFRFGFRGVPKNLVGCELRFDEGLRRWDFSGEQKLMQAMKDRLKEGMVAVDVGANFGIYTLLSGRIVGSQGEVHAFEPLTQNLIYLRRHVQLNRFDSWVKIHEMALSNSTDDTVRFYIPQSEQGLTVAAGIGHSENSSKEITVANARLDDFWKSSRKIDLIKIDVEGAELSVLQGAEKILRRDSPLLLIEVHDRELKLSGSSIEQLRVFLTNLGYSERLIDGAWVGRSGDFHALYEKKN